MPKILYLVQLPPPVHGASIMNKALVESCLIKDTLHTHVIRLKFVKEIQQIGKFSISKFYFTFIVFFKILKEMIFFKPDIVYITLSPVGGAFYRDVLFVSIIKFFKKKLVYHLHGKGIKKAAEVTFNKLLYKFVFHNVKVIHLSKILYKDIADFVKPSDCFFLPNGIPFNKSFTKINKKKNKKKIKILFLSNMALSKGPLCLLEAINIIKNYNYDIEVLFAGNWSKTLTKDKFFSYINKYDLQSVVRYLGPVYNEQKTNILKQADIFVFPTYYANECFPLVLLEALQAGLPIISTYEGAIPNIIEDGQTGFLVPQQNIDKLAQKLITLIESPDLRKNMSENAYYKFIENYTLEIFEHNLLKILKSILL
jgi:glycosyltransferase involved in cell wall biosynthesis